MSVPGLNHFNGGVTYDTPVAPPAGAPPDADAPPPVAPVGAAPDADSLAYKQQQFANALKGLVPDKQGNLTDPKTGQIEVPYGQVQMAVWTGAILPNQLPPGSFVRSKANGGGFDPGTLVPAGNGSYTTVSYDGKTPLVITPTGAVLNMDGTPVMENGKPEVSFQFQQTVNNPNNVIPKDPLGNLITDTLNAVQDQVTKGNPIAGTARAAYDIASGHPEKVAGDLTNGTTFGVASVDDKGNLTTGTSTNDVGTVATDAGAVVPNIPGLGDILSGLGLGGGGGVDTSAASDETKRANALADALGGKADLAGNNATYDRQLGLQTRDQQQQSIAGLEAAANGTAPSAAELQLKQQSGIDAARQYGLAAALQGNNPGAALRQASLGAAQIAGTTNQNAGVLRANEQATARGQLANTLAGVRQGDQNQGAADLGQQSTLTQGQLTSQGQGVTSTGQQLTAKTAEDTAKRQEIAAGIGAGGTLLSTLLSKSDKRAKRDIAKSDLADALAKGVHGVSFTYRPEAEEDDTPHFGILADELEKVIPGVVRKGASGFKEVHTGHLALANTGILSELARRLQDLEEAKGTRK